MKFTKNLKQLALFAIFTLFLINVCGSISLMKKGENAGSVQADSSIELERHKHHANAKNTAHAQALADQPVAAAIFNATNNTLSGSMLRDLNNSYVVQNLQTFKNSNRKWADNKLLDRQLEDIYQDLIYSQNKHLTPESSKAAIKIYVSQFEACDANHDNVLNLVEFSGCMVNDTFLSQIAPTNPTYATFANYSSNNSTGFYPLLFKVLDSYNLNYINFHDYMLIRLFAFSWRKCSVNGPFLEEVAFECSIEIASGWKTMPRNTARRLYNMALELSNTGNQRNIDFISYVIVAHSVRLYGKINMKEDSDATKTEFNLVLDSNVLPGRYNQDVINTMFRLVEENNKSAQGMDLLSFVYYDFVLRLFDISNPTKRFALNLKEFTGLFGHYLYPHSALGAFQGIQQNNLTADSYKMYTYLNISNYNQESDHFLKFSQTNEKVVAKSAGQLNAQSVNQTFNLAKTAENVFSILDTTQSGFISFFDYASFFQISYLFNKFDTFGRGRVVSGNLYENFLNYADFPSISVQMRERSRRFNLFPQDLYIDLLRAILVLRIDNLVEAVIRRSDPTTLYEVELKKIFAVIGLGAVPEAFVNKCLRGIDDQNVPKYDWECAFINAVTATLHYLESSNSYLTAKSSNLALTNTVFVNLDPAIK